MNDIDALVCKEATVHCAFKNESLEPTEDGMTVLPGGELRAENRELRSRLEDPQ